MERTEVKSNKVKSKMDKFIDQYYNVILGAAMGLGPLIMVVAFSLMVRLIN